MKVSERGLNIIKEYEQGPEGGAALESYLCSSHKWTIGWGHTKGVGPGMHATEAQCKQWLREDTRWVEEAINKYVAVPLSQNQFDALFALVFNIGAPQFVTSTLRRKLNDGDYAGAADEFPKWNKSNGAVLNGLIRRRADERNLFLSGSLF